MNATQFAHALSRHRERTLERLLQLRALSLVPGRQGRVFGAELRRLERVLEGMA